MFFVKAFRELSLLDSITTGEKEKIHVAIACMTKLRIRGVELLGQGPRARKGFRISYACNMGLQKTSQCL